MRDLETIRARYIEIEPLLNDVCEQLRSWLEYACQQLGIIDPRIDARVKTPHSLILKTYRKEIEDEPWDDPLADASDKVGARADLVYEEDVKKLADHINSSDGTVFAATTMDDKRQTSLGVDRLGYHGIHFDVVPKELPDGLDPGFARCEIQLRTNAQASWSMATHDLFYKAPVEPGVDLHRRVNRLTAMLELFDAEVTRARTEMIAKKGYPAATIISALEAARMRYIAEPYDRALTRDIVDALVRDVDGEGAEATAREIEEFRARRHSKLNGVLAASGSPVLTQPESILIYMRLEDDLFELRRKWLDEGLPTRLLEELAAAWNVTLPPWP